MKTEVFNRFKEYDKNHCWQYEIRQQNMNQDLLKIGMSLGDQVKLRTSDFEFSYIDKTDTEGCQEIKDFIERHEWLGKLPARPTHRFIARLKSTATPAGAIVMATPNAFSNILGKEYKDREKLISRGACISWAPKNLGSWLIMESIRWMVKNTEFSYFTAYSDPEAKELGTLYQACNFIYLGANFGTTKQYFDPNRPDLGWFSDREFRKRSKYRVYAENIGISKEQWKSWMKKYSPNWEIIPDDIRKKIKLEEKKYRDSCQCRETVSKHKYCYILGRTKRETKKLHKLYRERHPIILPYPQERGK